MLMESNSFPVSLPCPWVPAHQLSCTTPSWGCLHTLGLRAETLLRSALRSQPPDANLWWLPEPTNSLPSSSFFICPLGFIPETKEGSQRHRERCSESPGLSPLHAHPPSSTPLRLRLSKEARVKAHPLPLGCLDLVRVSWSVTGWKPSLIELVGLGRDRHRYQG